LRDIANQDGWLLSTKGKGEKKKGPKFVDKGEFVYKTTTEKRGGERGEQDLKAIFAG